MFDGKIYSLGIPVPQDVADKLQNLIFSIASEEPTLGIAKDLTKKIQVKPEFHITIGVFHHGIFQTNRGLFKHLLHFLNQNKVAYQQLKELFQGNIKITGIGFNEYNIANSDVIWASAESSEINTIRTKIHNIIQLADIGDEHFKFTDPHITLFMKSGKGDVHNISKTKKLPLNQFIGENHINFKFNTVIMYNGLRKGLIFGPDLDGKPSHLFKKALSQKISAEKKGKVEYKWGNLFKDPELKPHAKEIKSILLEHGPSGLAKTKYQKEIGKIMSLLKK